MTLGQWLTVAMFIWAIVMAGLIRYAFHATEQMRREIKDGDGE